VRLGLHILRLRVPGSPLAARDKINPSLIPLSFQAAQSSRQNVSGLILQKRLRPDPQSRFPVPAGIPASLREVLTIAIPFSEVPGAPATCPPSDFRSISAIKLLLYLFMPDINSTS